MTEKTYLLEVTHSTSRRIVVAAKMIVQNNTYLFFDKSGELIAAYPCEITIIVSVKQTKNGI